MVKFLWTVVDATKKFHAVITGSDTAELIRWMKRFWKTSIATLKTFIIGIMKDFKAVRNTIRLNVTNGITEGYVNKLKAVKRLMYGRAGIELLKNKLVLEHVLFN
jgi:transposase